MDISFIVILGLPVLYITGSLKKVVTNTEVSGFAFVMYFACTAALSLIPAVGIVQGMRISLAGAFFCIAPAVYLAIKKRYTYRYYLVFVLTTLVAVMIAFFSSTYTITYLPYMVGFAIAIVAVACFKAKAPVFAPFMMGIYSVAGGIMNLLGGMNDSITFFSGIGMVSLCTAFCLFAAYIVTRPRGKHAARPLEVQHDKG